MITRSVNGCPIGYGDMYYNAPVNTLPLDVNNTAKIAALSGYRLGPSPEFYLNVVNNTTPTYPSSQMIWDAAASGEVDAGNYPMTQSTQVSLYLYGKGTPISGGPYTGNDDHVIMLNTDTCVLYETYLLQNNAPPYHNVTGSIDNLKAYDLRTAAKQNSDSDGLDNGTASGMAIWPEVLTHAEIFSGNPIVHGTRIGLGLAQGSPGFQWPATHMAGGTGTAGIYLGTTLRLPANYDTSTCHNEENAGQPYPAWFQRVLTAFQTYGIYFADYTGSPGLIGTDADQGWGDPNSSSSDNWVFAGWLHCIRLTDLEVVDNQARIISLTSGRVQTNFPAR